jgi:putative transposase
MRPHFVTIRCAGSLPIEAHARVREVHAALRRITANSAEFAALQRKYFLICERFLDAGYGFCPLRDGAINRVLITQLDRLAARNGWTTEHFVLMPNHVHLLLRPMDVCSPLRVTVRGWKWRTAKDGNAALRRTGPFWQSDWFDRWARTEAEEVRMRDYIRQNPIKAGLVSRWSDYPWVR